MLKIETLKIHHLLTEAVTENIRLVFSEGKKADKVIEYSLKKNLKWGSRDRRFVAESTYEIIRHYRLLQEAAGSKNPWMLLATYLIKNNLELPEWKEFSGISSKPIKHFLQKNEIPFAVSQSIPDWMQEMGEKELGERWEKEIDFLNQEAKVVLRTNTLKITREKLQQRLKQNEILTFTHDEIAEALILQKRQQVFSSAEFKNGFFEVQDASSQRVAHFMDLQFGQRVIDACAGAGGKSLHISALLHNKGKIIAMDVEDRKLQELKKRAARAGANNIETRLIEKNTIQRLKESADRLLLDAPCSGMGVLRRNPDSKWKLSPEKIEVIKLLQTKILNEYSSMVKPGGKLIYVTCSILPSENEMQTKKFLENNHQFELEEEKTIFPSDGFDGFYLCRMKKV